MNVRQLLVLGVVPVAASLHGVGNNLAWSLVWRKGSGDLGMSYSDISSLMSLGAAVGIAGTVVGVVLGALLGAPLAGAIGLFVASAGLLAHTGLDSPTGFSAAVIINAVGVGIYRPAMIGAALREFGPAHENTRMSLLLATYACANLSVIPSTVVSTLIDAGGWGVGTLVLVISAGLSALAGALYVLLAASGIVVDPSPSSGRSLSFLVGPAAAAIVGGMGYFATSLGAEWQWRAISLVGESSAWWWGGNVVITVGTCILAASGLGAACTIDLRWCRWEFWWYPLR